MRKSSQNYAVLRRMTRSFVLYLSQLTVLKYGLFRAAGSERTRRLPMATRALWSFVVIILVCFAMSDDALSADVAVVYSIDSSETNGETAVKSWGSLEKRTGLELRHLSVRRQGERFEWEMISHFP